MNQKKYIISVGGSAVGAAVWASVKVGAWEFVGVGVWAGSAIGVGAWVADCSTFGCHRFLVRLGWP